MSRPQVSVPEIVAWLRATVPSALDGAHHLQLDSRRIAPGDVFVAVPGAVPGKSADGRDHVRAAAALGAAAALVEAEAWTPLDIGLPVLPVSGLRRLLGPLAADFYRRPSEKLLAIGVTGTNGKTSCTQWIAQVLTLEGTRCAVIGTVGSGFPGAVFAGAALTTPDAIALQREVRALLDAGARALAMEVSSIGLDQGRVDGMAFDIALFTSLTRDHLDYHGTLERYEAAKARLFDWPTLSHAVINLDDAAGQRLAARLARRSGLRVTGFTARDAPAPAPLALRLAAHAVRATATGLQFEVDDGNRRIEVAVPLVGAFNVSNLLGVLGVAAAAGIALEPACGVLPQLAPPPGRMQRVGGEGAPLAVVDYAHTPDALAQALVALAPLAQARGGRLWVVFGAGGDRDPGKRAPMGEAAARFADRVVLTSDNPRTEAPEAIVAAIARGVPADCAARVEHIVDRGQAIAHALAAAADADVVLIAGKGHEDTQDVGGMKRPFSDLEHARAALARRAAATGAGTGAAAGRGSAGGGRMMTVAELAQRLPQSALHGDGGVRFTGVSTDTRSAAAGCVFFALRGSRFDAHDFVAQAVERGAVAVVVERRVDVKVPQIVVADARRALGAAAAAWRARFALPLIAVTGSNGKTTVTQMIAAILAAAYGADRRLATRGNLNNDVGLPLMLFELAARHRAAVLELGMNHPGEIAYLAQLAAPTVALVNNAQREHQEFMASVEATAHENGAAIAALPSEGVAVFPADDSCAAIWRRLAGTRRVIDFARAGAAAVTATSEPAAAGSRLAIATPQGPIETSIGAPGAHNVHNALAATAACVAIGVPNAAIAAGLAAFAPVAGRGVRLATAGGAALIDDTYNANPDSMRAAIDVLAACAPPRVLVIGDMGEVGSQGPAFHREIGAHARSRGIETLLAIGALSREAVAAFGAGARHFDDIDALIAAAAAAATPGATLLVKGSRFMRMERVVRALAATDTAGAG